VISDLFSVNFHRNSQSFEQNVDNLKGLPQAAPGSEGAKGKVDGPFGPRVLKILRFDSGKAAEGCGIAASRRGI
jgi:hypothetical protein